jgi:hypothetical protein
MAAVAAYYTYTIHMWFTLNGHLMPHNYKWFSQDGLANILPTAIVRKFQLPITNQASVPNPENQN